PEEAYARRDAHTITHWLGTDAPELTPHIETMTVPGPGIVLVCSDGLWNYYETPASLRELVAAGPPGEGVLETARRLVDAALEAGGHDNITVAVKSLGAPSWASGASRSSSSTPRARWEGRRSGQPGRRPPPPWRPSRTGSASPSSRATTPPASSTRARGGSPRRRARPDRRRSKPPAGWR